MPWNWDIQKVRVLDSSCVYGYKLGPRTMEQSTVSKLADKTRIGEQSCRLQQKRNQMSVVIFCILRLDVMERQNLSPLGQCCHGMAIQHEQRYGAHIRRKWLPIRAYVLFVLRKAIPLSRRIRCCMHERISQVTWEIPPHPERVTLAISETKCHGTCEGKSEQEIVAMRIWKHEGAKGLQFGPFLYQGKRHYSLKGVSNA